MNDQLAQITEHFQALCARHGLPVRISTVRDENLPKVQPLESADGYHICLNLARVGDDGYAAHLGYHIGNILLPRLRLETDRLLLRRFQPQDADACFALLSHEADAHMDCARAFDAMDEEFHARLDLLAQRETQYMVVLKDSGEVVGTVQLFGDESRAVSAMEIGYAITHCHQRKGYAFEALSALLSLLQEDLHLDMVTAGVLPENTASEKLLKKLGFHQEGLRHKAVWHEGLGRPVDLIYFYRDRPDTTGGTNHGS